MKLRVWMFFLGMLGLSFAGIANASTCASPTKPQEVDVPDHPFSALPSADGCWLFASQSGAGNHGAIAVLRNVDGVFRLDHVVPLKGAVYGEALTRDGKVLIAVGERDVDVLDIAKLEQNNAAPLLGTLHDGSQPGAVYAVTSADDRLLFVSDEDVQGISVFDLDRARKGGYDKALIGRIPMAISPVGLALSPDGKWLYATSEVARANMRLPDVCQSEQGRGQKHPQGMLFRIDVNLASQHPERAAAAAVLAGCNPVRVVVEPSGKHLWVTARGDNAVLEFDAIALQDTGHASYGKFDIGPSPVGIAVRPDGMQLWVALSNRFGGQGAGQLAGLMFMPDGSSAKRMSAPASGFPREVAFLPDGRTLIATLFATRRIELMPTPP